MLFKYLMQFLLVFFFSVATIFYYIIPSINREIQEKNTFNILGKVIDKVYIDYSLFAISSLTTLILLIYFLSILRKREERQRSENRIDQLYELIAKTSKLCENSSDLTSIYNKICQDIVEIVKFDFVWIGKYASDSRSIEPLASFGHAQALLEDTTHNSNTQNESAEIRAYLKNRTIVNNNLHLQKGKNYTYALKNHLQSNAAFLIKSSSGENRIFAVYSRHQNSFDHQIITLLQKIADDLSHAIEHIRARTVEEQHIEQMRISAAAFETQEAMIITDSDHKIVKVNEAYLELTKFSKNEVLGKNPNIVKSGEHDTEFYKKLWQALERDGKWKGEIINKNRNGKLFTVLASISTIKDEDGKITHYIEQSLDISDQKRTHEQITKQAYHDALTGLANRTLLIDRLGLTLGNKKRTGEYGSLFFIDMDNFKHINDSYGHDVGDLLLIEVAQRLLNCVRAEDTVARIGGDEFVVLLDNLGKNKEEAGAISKKIAENVLVSLAKTYQCNNNELFSSPSIGITLFPDLSFNAEEVLKQADVSMYMAKNAGKNGMHFYNEDLDTKLKQQKAIERNLREAMLHDEFEIYLQPQLSCKTNEIVGFESFIYWNHPTKGILPPEKFLSVIENNSFIIPIQEWILESTCKYIQNNITLLQGEQYISVAISNVFFKQKKFIENLKDVLDRTGIIPEKLELQISESVISQNTPETIAKINELDKLGVHCILNDFTKGFSSLFHLQNLPIRTFKIDKQLVKNIVTDQNSYAIIETIIKLAHNLNLNVIAEGLTIEKELVMLRELECDHYQGDLHTPALSDKELRKAFT